jgi:hypothetical protein
LLTNKKNEFKDFDKVIMRELMLKGMGQINYSSLIVNMNLLVDPVHIFCDENNKDMVQEIIDKVIKLGSPIELKINFTSQN